MAAVLGLDIGGANLKAVHADGTAKTLPFALWKHPDRLAAALASLIEVFPPNDTIAVTMTGELCDCFATKREGVRCIVDAVTNISKDRKALVWTTDGEFIPAQSAHGHSLKAAASNWHALATCAGRFVKQGASLLIDIGSTTADIIPLIDGVPAAIGKTDTERLRSCELVYTGVKRTPVCALLGGTVMAELFATTLDVYLLLDDLPESDDVNTADGRPATKPYAHSRLARMIGGDGDICNLEETLGVARKAASAQESILRFALRRVLGTLPSKPAKVVISGAGEFLAERVLLRERFAKDQLVYLSEQLGPAVSTAACAHAVAVLAGEETHAA